MQRHNVASMLSETSTTQLTHSKHMVTAAFDIIQMWFTMTVAGETYPGESGSMVPFTLRLLWAELPALVAADIAVPLILPDISCIQPFFTNFVA